MPHQKVLLKRIIYSNVAYLISKDTERQAETITCSMVDIPLIISYAAI